LKPEWWGSPLAQEETYQGRNKPVIRDDDDDDNDDDDDDNNNNNNNKIKIDFKHRAECKK
jgi:hypothetical protein